MQRFVQSVESLCLLLVGFKLYDDVVFFISLSLDESPIEEDLNADDQVLLYTLIGDAYFHTNAYGAAIKVRLFASILTFFETCLF